MSLAEQTIIERVVDALKRYGPEKIYLFGSWARGEGDELSDLDLVLIKETEMTFFERLKEIQGLLPDNIGGIDILIYTPSEFQEMQSQGNAFVEMILEEGNLIYEKQTK